MDASIFRVDRFLVSIAFISSCLLLCWLSFSSISLPRPFESVCEGIDFAAYESRLHAADCKVTQTSCSLTSLRLSIYVYAPDASSSRRSLLREGSFERALVNRIRNHYSVALPWTRVSVASALNLNPPAIFSDEAIFLAPSVAHSSDTGAATSSGGNDADDALLFLVEPADIKSAVYAKRPILDDRGPMESLGIINNILGGPGGGVPSSSSQGDLSSLLDQWSAAKRETSPLSVGHAERDIVLVFYLPHTSLQPLYFMEYATADMATAAAPTANEVLFQHSADAQHSANAAARSESLLVDAAEGEVRSVDPVIAQELAEAFSTPSSPSPLPPAYPEEELLIVLDETRMRLFTDIQLTRDVFLSILHDDELAPSLKNSKNAAENVIELVDNLIFPPKVRVKRPPTRSMNSTPSEIVLDNYTTSSFCTSPLLALNARVATSISRMQAICSAWSFESRMTASPHVGAALSLASVILSNVTDVLTMKHSGGPPPLPLLLTSMALTDILHDLVLHLEVTPDVKIDKHISIFHKMAILIPPWAPAVFPLLFSLVAGVRGLFCYKKPETTSSSV